MGASSEARKIWPERFTLESIESIVRTLTMVLSGIVTTTGFGGGGGGGGGGGVGAEGSLASLSTGPGFVCVSEAGVAGTGAGTAAGAGAAGLRDARAGFSGRFGGSRAGDGGARFSATAGGGAIVVRSMIVFTPEVFVAICSAASRAPSSETWPVSVTTPSFVATSTLDDFSEALEYICALIEVLMESSLGLLQARHTNAKESAETRYRRDMQPPELCANNLSGRNSRQRRAGPQRSPSKMPLDWVPVSGIRLRGP